MVEQLTNQLRDGGSNPNGTSSIEELSAKYNIGYSANSEERVNGHTN